MDFWGRSLTELWVGKGGGELTVVYVKKVVLLQYMWCVREH